MTMAEMIDAEAKDLTVHVQLCAQRHAAVEARLTRIERAIWATLGVVSTAAGLGASQVLPIVRALGGH